MTADCRKRQTHVSAVTSHVDQTTRACREAQGSGSSMACRIEARLSGQTNPVVLRCRPLLPKIIRAAATSASRRMTLTVAGRGALTSKGPHRIDHAHGYGSNFYRSEHRHSNCSRPRCLSVALATSTCCATLAKTTLGEVRDRGSTAGFSVGCRRSQASKSIVHKSCSLMISSPA